MSTKLIQQIATTGVLPQVDDYAEFGGATAGSTKMLKSAILQQVASRAALSVLDNTNCVSGFQVQVGGGSSLGDGAGQFFYYSSSSTATVNGVTILATFTGTGRWLWVAQYIPPSGVAAGSYGNFDRVPAVQYDALGRAVAASDVLIGGNALRVNEVVRFLNDSTADVFNVKSWGAEGDGTTNDTVAIQNCFNAAANANVKACVYFPSGTYILNAQITIGLAANNSLAVRGDSSGTTILYWNNGSTNGGGIYVTLNSSQYFQPLCTPVKVEGLTLLTKGNGAGTALKIVAPTPVVPMLPWNIIRDLAITGEGSVNSYWAQAIDFTNPFGTLFKNLNINANSGIILRSPSATANNIIQLSNCYFVSNTGYCLDFESSTSGFQGILIGDCNFISTNPTGAGCINGLVVSGGGGSEDWVIRDSYFRTDGTGGYSVSITSASQGAARSWVHDCFFDYSSGMGGHIKITKSEQMFVHDNLFLGGSTEVGLDIDSTNGGSVSRNQFVNVGTDFILRSGAVNINVVENQYLDSTASNYRANRGTDAGTNNKVGNTVSYPHDGSVAVILLTGGSPTEIHTVDITKSGFISAHPGVIAQNTGGTLQSTIGIAYDFDNGSTNATTATIQFFTYNGGNLPAAFCRYTLLTTP